MKKITKILALALVLALVFSLTACAGKANIAGAWKYNIDVMKVMEASGEMDDMFGEDSEMTEEQVNQIKDVFKKLFTDLDLTMVLDLKEDNTFKMAMDENAAKTASETLSQRLPELMPDLLTAMFGGEETVNALLEAYDMTMDDLVESFGDEFSAEDLLESLDEDSVTGTYTYEDGKLVLTADDEDKPVTLTVDLSAKELKVTAIDSENADDEELEMYKTLLPVVFTR